MVQLRWTDETVWKDCPWLHSIEQAEEEWERYINRIRPTSRPTYSVEFRIRPYFTMDAQARVV